ncbi:phospholipid carrier-dependent glycosyltransferase [Candidatus Roizmanbacteria bacterium]|nr:phospholipid carrier-dependent glycosyltransferase [Candidatus Roizmanbacteria bacterium]
MNWIWKNGSKKVMMYFMFLFTLPLLALGLWLRNFGIEWDQLHHLHPDERMLIMVTSQIQLFDKMNPDFFNYGSLPLYILRGVAQVITIIDKAQVINYDTLLPIGRSLSTFFDLCTGILLYATAKKLTTKKWVPVAAFYFYIVAFFPIQNSHFFIVDTFLNCFITLLIYACVRYFQCPTGKGIIAISLALAAACATKFTAIIFFPFPFIVFGLKNNWKQKYVFQSISFFLYQSVVFIPFLGLFNFLFQPYAYLLPITYMTANLTQIRMNSDAYVFPYTLQYVDTLPYLYQIKNIFWFGLGPIISLLALTGMVFLLRSAVQHRHHLPAFVHKHEIPFFIATVYLFYFLIIGHSAVKFMRYMLPLYVPLSFLAGWGLVEIAKWKKLRVLVVGLPLLALVYSGCFETIYARSHTRIDATTWILNTIPTGSRIAFEHWDDMLPLWNSDQYQMIELPLYDLPDNSIKWEVMKEKLNSSNYIIIASNRLITPLQKLADCEKFEKCYHNTAQYYRDLLAGRLGYVKVAEFSSNPELPFLRQFIGSSPSFSDQWADESFTVYDHPKIMIFKNTRTL